MRILITSGGTREPIDAARFVTNMSTGATGAALAGRLAERGCSVLCLCAAGGVAPSGEGIEARSFVTFADLDQGLKRALKAGAFDAVIHAAAVSDFTPVLVEAGGMQYRAGPASKLDSLVPELRVTLRRNPKLIARIRSYAAAGWHPEPLVVGFKLTASATPGTVLCKVRALEAAGLVVHNDLAEMAGGRHPFHLYRAGEKIADLEGPLALADRLYEELSKEAACC